MGIDSDLDDELLRLDPDLLWDVGFRDLTRAQVTDVLEDLYSTLEMRVGSRLIEGLDDNQLATFERLIDRGDDAAADKWLRENKPGYRRVVRDEFEDLVAALRRAATFSSAGRDGKGMSVVPEEKGEIREPGGSL